MTDTDGRSIPADDPERRLTLANADDPELPHVGVAANTYTILLRGEDTGGRYSLIDMHVLPGGGPPPHRHDFEEMFTVLEGEVELTFRGKVTVARAGDTVNVPANAPHSFKNVSAASARLLCMCTPPGQEHFFLETGVPVGGRTAVATSTPKDQQDRRELAMSLAPKYRTEFLT